MGAGKGYSAGAIFLQVVPVFRNVQDAIKDEAKNWDRALGDEMEKSGEKAGERAGKAASKAMTKELENDLRKGVADISKALDGVDTRNLSKKMRGEVKAMAAEFDALKDIDLKVDDNFDAVSARAKAVRGEIEEMRKRSKVFFDVKGLPNVYRAAKQAEQIIGQIDGTIKLDVDTKPAEREISAFEKNFKAATERAAKALSGKIGKEAEKLRDELKYLQNLRVGIDISASQAKRELGEIKRDLDRLNKQTVEPDVKAGTFGALGELKVFEQYLDKIDGRDINVTTNGARRNINGVAKDADNAANSFRSFNIVLLAAAGAGPALVPVLGAIAGGLLAIGPAAGVAAFGLGSVLVGFSGLGDAIGALQAKQEQQATTSQTAAKQNKAASYAIADAARAVRDAERNAAEAAEDAAERVADARERAAEMVEDALDRQRDAQRRYADSIDDVRHAEQALRDARRAAAGTGAELDRAIRENALSIDQGQLDAFDATVQYNALQSDGSATNAEQEQARINMEEARLRLEELRAEAKELAAEKKRWDKEGVNGTEEVRSAQDNLNAALEAQRDAYQGVRDAAAAVDEARRDGAEMVSDAIEAQNETLRDNARAIADARRGLARAREGAEEVATAINSQDQALQNAMDNLGPAGRKFALFLYGLRDEFKRFRDDIQTAMLPSIQSAIEGFMGSKNAGTARGAMVGLAGGFGGFTEELSASLQGPAWGGFFEMLRDLGPQIQEAWGGAFIKLMEALASILTTLAPYALDFALGLERLMETFANWASSEAGQESLIAFMEYAKEIGPDVLKAFGALAVALANLLVAMAPYSEGILAILTAFFVMIGEVATGPLGAFVGGLLAIITASQIAYAVMNLLMAGTALVTSAIGFFVFMAVGAALAVVYLYRQNETLGIIVGIVAGAVLALVAAIKIHMIWTGLVAAAQTGYAIAMGTSTAALTAQSTATRIAAAVTKGFIAVQAAMNAVLLGNPIAWVIIAIVALVAAIVYLWKNHEGFRDFVMDAWAKIKHAFGVAWEYLKIGLAAIGDAMMWLWNKAIKPALGFIGAAFKATFKAISWVWNKILWPVFKFIGKAIWTLWKVQFKVALVLIKAAFKATMIALRWVWENILKPVFKGIAIGAKWLWENGLKPVFGWIGRRWDEVLNGMKWVWNNVLKPVFDYIADKAMPKLKGAFRTTVDAIKEIWEGLKKAVGKPIKFVLETIINKGLIGGFNKVANWVGMDGFDPINIPNWLQSYATGGVMPGYTPGKDVHEFVSPTAGRLRLSGGEAVMRPEWTAVMGPDYVNRMNQLAMRGGTRAIQDAVYGKGGYWMGGVLPLPGGSVSSHGNAYGYPAFDLNYPGYADFGAAVKAFKDGIVAQMNYIGDASYGRWAVLNHGGQSSLYAHLSSFARGLAVGDSVRAGQTIGHVGDLGNTGNPPTSHLHFEIMGGNVDYADTATGGGGGGRSLPSWLMSTLKDPLGAVKGWVTSGWDKASDLVTGSPVFDYVKKVPLLAAEKVTDKVWDVVPGWAKTAAGWAGDAADWAVGGVKNALGAAGDIAQGVGGGIKDGVGAAADFLGLYTGGILPYNGTMMYDDGGYLPPGLTTVVNLTGKPEPVFTDDQWSSVNGGQGGNIHYEPHFEGSNLTAEDVAGDLNFTFRRMKRGGKYAGVGEQ